ncbi:MAG: cytochrome c biogenesis protein CcdA [Opitutaceae bacterium]|jgi:cytochrome c biogenesis protein CcdA
MIESITSSLQSASMGPAALPLAFLLGLLSALASACCTLPAMGMLVAYSGTREDANRRTAFASAISFMIGTTLALIVLGFVAGFVGQAAQAMLGRYWKLFAGVIAIGLGLAALKLFPLKLPQFTRKTEMCATSHGMLGSVMLGLLMGGGVAAASLPCNPGIFIVIGASILMGHIFWGMVLMAAFGMGFSLPLGAILFGVAFGKASIKAQRAEAVIRGVAGFLLVGAGFYLLAMF